MRTIIDSMYFNLLRTDVEPHVFLGEGALGVGLISARRLTPLTPLLRHLQLPIVCIRLRLSAVCVRAHSAADFMSKR